MNEYNHHRIIERFAANVKGLSNTDVQTLKGASNFTDDFIGASQKGTIGTEINFFLYHFYYDIICENGIIVLQRCNSDDYRFEKSMGKCDYDKDKYETQKVDYSKITLDYPTETTYIAKHTKLFFSTINDRESYLINAFVDNSNQSDCVAFLHAMGAKNENLFDSEKIFRDHLKSCFSEFIFVKNHKEAMFMLGIAFHGIMDSFTPSHTGFQQYANQDMAMHAQGDVVPIKGEFGAKTNEFHIGTELNSEKVEFFPGQYDKENFFSRNIADRYKGFNVNNHVNETEYLMLRIFFLISEITDSGTNYNIAQEWSSLVDFWKTFEGNTLKQINDVLKSINIEHTQSLRYKYGDNAYVFSETAINTMTEIYNILVKERQECLNDYEQYKEIKENDNKAIKEALKIWERKYNEMHNSNSEKINYLKTLFKHKITGDVILGKDKTVNMIARTINNFDHIKPAIKEIPFDKEKLTEETLEQSGINQMNLRYGGLNKI